MEMKKSFYCPNCGRFLCQETLADVLNEEAAACLADRQQNAEQKQGLSYAGNTVIASQAAQIHELRQEIRRLRADNRMLSDTVSWMHDTIWELAMKNKIL